MAVKGNAPKSLPAGQPAGAQDDSITSLFSSWFKPTLPGLSAETLQALPGPALLQAAYAYGVDAWQRGVLYTDVMRQRGNQYLVHMAKREPNVLAMESEVLLDGREFERPVNYMLLRIVPPADTPADPEKRPFLVVDPRAGHGPGIGGFKPESEIGVAVRAGHPCYFASFLPQPTPTQTVEDVMRAEARFLETIIDRHPDAEGKPVVVGNCQAGWQIMMTAAMRPELFGPIIVAGAPLSYWAGWRNKNPMRYSGGLLGGSWLTEMTSDMGNGKFDGAWLVQNFENLNPANTLWSKQYNLYSKVDTEAPRYLEFEKWWGGHVFLNAPEIQYIVDNLFIGNRLATAGLVTSDGIRIDLRNIRSPIIVFCSKGDNITPPPQALGWITDLYQDDKEVIAHGQTIVYAVHESVGHLGIFVSGSVARKEHLEFTSNIDMIDVLPPGIYQTEIADKTPETANADLAQGNYVLSFARRNLDDVRQIVQRLEEDDRRFAAVARISDINLGMYRSFLRPWVQAVVTPQTAEWAQRLHPLRLPYELISDRNPSIAPIAQVAEQVREHREPVAADNPFLVAQQMVSQAIVAGLEIFTELRDAAVERTFMNVFGSLPAQNLAGLGARPGAPRKHPGVSPEHLDFMRRRQDELRARISQGGAREAAIRMVLAVSGAGGGLDERSYAMIRRLRADSETSISLQDFKDAVRDQALLMLMDGPAAVRAIPKLLENVSADGIRLTLATMRHIVEATQPLTPRAQEALQEMERLFETAERRARRREGGQPQDLSQLPLIDAFSATDVGREALQVAGLDLPATRSASRLADKPAAKPGRKTAARPASKRAAKTPAKPAAAKKATPKKVAPAAAKTAAKPARKSADVIPLTPPRARKRG
ncbi:DUF3141 domain-containing protein [Bordetella genomosp. 12]|uniref:3-hydroxyalkanoate synthetase n=1 Tax=Bordetella genomosp. 12 TaxID=463035 RepID=A0A261VB83_9BORD|nr:DUF3141 domain-containing protein [Bordetella genomosp. 12]OZI71067.1 3-hydroxyalkanoate synthetase [Bordetella genomosp. 12]